MPRSRPPPLLPERACRRYNEMKGGTCGARFPMGKTRIDTTDRKKLSDEQLLLRYQQGDIAAFEELVHRYERELYHFLARFLGDGTLAEDVFQETFLQVHLSAEGFDVTHHRRQQGPGRPAQPLPPPGGRVGRPTEPGGIRRHPLHRPHAGRRPPARAGN